MIRIHCDGPRCRHTTKKDDPSPDWVRVESMSEVREFGMTDEPLHFHNWTCLHSWITQQAHVLPRPGKPE